MPVSLSVIVTVLAILTALGLIYRVLISMPGPDSLFGPRPAPTWRWPARWCCVYAGIRSMREEAPARLDGSAAIPTVDLGPRR